MTIFEFLGSAELAYLGWGNNIQKAYRLYNKHLSDEIKYHIINISHNFSLMKTWLIIIYGGLFRMWGILLIIYLENPKQQVGTERRSLSIMLQSLKLSRELRGCCERIILTDPNWKLVCCLVAP